MDRLRLLFPIARVVAPVVMWSGVAATQPWPMPDWERAEPEAVGMDAARLSAARDYALSGGGSGYVIRHGKLVLSWGDPRHRYDLKSTTKSIGVTALGVAIADGRVRLADKASRLHPSFAVPPATNRTTGWVEHITLEHLATQTAGFEKPGGYTALQFEPGARWAYSDGGPNWLAECLTLVYRRDLADLLFERVFSPLGIGAEDLTWRHNQYRDRLLDGLTRREFGSGISANVNSMARIGYLYLREGRWEDAQLLPAAFVRAARSSVSSVKGPPVIDAEQYGRASDHYGLLWWNNADGTLAGVPRDAFWSWGLYDSLILVMPSLDLVAARAGRSWEREGGGHYDVLKPFFRALVDSIGDRALGTVSGEALPHPASPVIEGIQWAPASTILRRARGSDNWPMTWGDDDRLYTAYGDGHGFAPRVERKLSLGLAVVEGGPEDFTGHNLRAPTAERVGDGSAGPKASGMLMVDGVLYMWVRNTGNAQLAWSQDHGKTWIWCPWRFSAGFGYPTFLNFGSNYAGARDAYVYVYSHDADSAYERADRMVLARVPKARIRDREAYRFFERLDNHEPVWTRDIHSRGAVFTRPGQCYRSSVSYHAPSGRYLWCQTGGGDDTRFQGGFVVCDAPEPWGPWTMVFSTSQWDVGPGETAGFPTKWMGADRHTVHLVFSGEDAFSVRKGTLLFSGDQEADFP